MAAAFPNMLILVIVLILLSVESVNSERGLFCNRNCGKNYDPVCSRTGEHFKEHSNECVLKLRQCENVQTGREFIQVPLECCKMQRRQRPVTCNKHLEIF